MPTDPPSAPPPSASSLEVWRQRRIDRETHEVAVKTLIEAFQSVASTHGLTAATRALKDLLRQEWADRSSGRFREWLGTRQLIEYHNESQGQPTLQAIAGGPGSRTEVFHRHLWLDHPRRCRGESGPVLYSEPYDIDDRSMAEIAAECTRLGLACNVSPCSPWNPGASILLRFSRRS